MNRIVTSRIFFLGLCIVSMFTVCLPQTLIGQEGEQESTQKEVKKAKKARMQLDYFNINNQEFTIKATVKTKEGRSYVTVADVPVLFNVSSEDEKFDTALGEVISDAQGVAQVTGKVSDLPLSGLIIFEAGIEASTEFKKYSKSLEVLNAEMEIDFVTEDSTNLIKVRCARFDSTGLDIPVDDLDIKVYVERLFGELPISTEFNFTDDDGEVEILFPQNVGGDSDGLLAIVVRVEDHDDYGNLVGQKDISWGTPLIQTSNGKERLLWAGKYKAPIPLVILVNGVLIVVWGLIFYIALNILRIFRLGKSTKSALQT